MELPILIEPLPNQAGFTARLMAPIELSAEGATADEAHERLAEMLREKLANGLQIRTLKLATPLLRAGWLPDDELTQEWRQHMQAYRDECDAEDRARILGEEATQRPAP
jgi:hypothetical protein